MVLLEWSVSPMARRSEVVLALEWPLACWRLVIRFASAGADGSVVGVVGVAYVGDFGGADGVSVFVGFKECWSGKEYWSVLVLAHGTQR